MVNHKDGGHQTQHTLASYRFSPITCALYLSGSTLLKRAFVALSFCPFPFSELTLAPPTDDGSSREAVVDTGALPSDVRRFFVTLTSSAGASGPSFAVRFPF